jgi:YidC/Oxa1 family membrane protein insertase
MSQPAPKQNFLQTALFMIVVIMAFQLWSLTQQNHQTQISTAQHYLNLKRMNANRMDVSIVAEKAAYDSSIDADVKLKKLTEAQAEAKKVESAILVADTQLKAGIHTGETSRIRDAYNTLQPLEKQYVDKPIWNTPVDVADVTQDKTYGSGWKQWTGQGLYTNVVDRLTEKNKTDLVYGIIPGYGIMDFLVHVTGGIPGFSYAFAGFLLAFCVRSLVFPLSQKQLMFSRQMSQLTPMVKEIKDQFPNDPAEQQKRTMKVYQEYGINPFSGCWPALIQLPLFLTVYQCMIRYQFAFQKGTFLWMNKATSQAVGGWIAPNLGQMDYILIVIYGVTMMVSTLLTPASDPSQVKQQRLMSIGISLMFTVFMFTGRFPVVSGFVLYWVFTNMLSTAQSLRAYRLPMPPLVKVNTPNGGTYPVKQGRWAKFLEQAQQMQEDSKQSGGNSASSKWLNNDSSVTDDSKPKLGGDEGGTGTPAKHKPKKRK